MKKNRLLCILFLFLSVFSCSEQEPFPEELIGRWETDVLSYDDRFIEISEEEIILGTGGVDSNYFFIRSYKSMPRGNTVHWMFSCETNPGELFEIPLIFYPDESEPRLQMENVLEVDWYKVEEIKFSN